MNRFLLIIIVFSLIIGFRLNAEDGMYPIFKISDYAISKMKEYGLKISKDDFWKNNDKSIAKAIVKLGGGTGSFVSPFGLIITNHHVAYGAVQKQSTPEHNYVKEGFIADNLESEIIAPGYTAKVLVDVKNVTKEFKKILTKRIKPSKRYKLYERKVKELIKSGEKRKGVECEVKSFFGGNEIYLLTYFYIKDIRIVYVPPRSIGEYGGEIDNWMWPRHTGDFSFLRAYVGKDGFPADYSRDNIPFKSKSYLKLSNRNLNKGDLTIVIGFPGRTSRLIPSEAIKNEVDSRYPEGIKLLRGWIETLENASKKSESIKIKNLGILKGLYNAIKNYRGMLEGLKKYKLYEKKLELENKMYVYAMSDKRLKRQYHNVIKKINLIYYQLRNINEKVKLLGWMSAGVKALNWARTIEKWSKEKMKKDIERKPGYMDRDIKKKKFYMRIQQKTYDEYTDKQVLKYFLNLLLTDKYGNEDIIKYFGLDKGISIDKLTDDLYKSTTVIDVKKRMEYMDMNRNDIINSNDSFIEFAALINSIMDRYEKKLKKLKGRLLKVRPLYYKLLIDYKKSVNELNIYPDANSTLRLNFGIVKGYSPKDAVYYLPFTTLKGVIEKDTGKFPFDLDVRVVDTFNKKDYKEYIDPELNDVPVNFLTTNDTTGGNSGSPVLNAYGEVIGLLFDGNYESLSSDFYFNEEITRSICVDIRYVKFIADKVNNAKRVLKELEKKK